MRQVMAAAMLATALAIAPAHAREAEAQERSPGALAAGLSISSSIRSRNTSRR